MQKILGIILVISAIVTSSLTSCTTSGSTTAQDVPQYRADQVIYIVQAKYPSCIRYSNQTLRAETNVGATYIGNKVWKATVTCPSGYNMEGYSQITVYFYEADGSLWGGYNSTTKTLSSPR